MAATPSLTGGQADEIRRLSSAHAAAAADHAIECMRQGSTVRSRNEAAENLGEAFGALIAYLEQLVDAGQPVGAVTA